MDNLVDGLSTSGGSVRFMGSHGGLSRGWLYLGIPSAREGAAVSGVIGAARFGSGLVVVEKRIYAPWISVSSPLICWGFCELLRCDGLGAG